jgi:cobalt-zinc-cadmium efflux system outer membrane protein
MTISLGRRSPDHFRSRQLWAARRIARGVLTAIALWFVVIDAVAADQFTDMLTLDQAEEIALAANPALAGMQAQAEAMAEVPSQAGALPDPMLGLNAMNMPVDTFNLDQEPMTQMQVSLSQAFPFPGKRGLRRAAAEHEATAASSAVSERRLLVLADVRTVWWRIFALDRALVIVLENQALMRQFVQIAQTKYKVGAGLQQDVLLAQLELSRLLNDELQLTGRRGAAAAELNALLDRPPAYAVRLAAQPPNDHLPELAAEADLLQRALENRPLLAGQRELVEAARDRADLAKRDYYPDFRLGAAYGFRDTADRITGETLPDFLSVMISVNLPIYSSSRQSKALSQRRSELSQWQFLLGDSLRSVESAISQNSAQYVAARRQVSLFSTAILPQAEQTVQSMLAGYQVNEVDFLNVVNAELRLFDAQVSYWEALGNAKQSLARLAAAVGEESLYE